MAQAETASSEHTLTAGPTRVYRPPWETRFVPPLAPNSSERDIPYARLVALGAMVAGATATADHRRDHRARDGALALAHIRSTGTRPHRRIAFAPEGFVEGA